MHTHAGKDEGTGMHIRAGKDECTGMHTRAGKDEGTGMQVEVYSCVCVCLHPKCPVFG